MYKTVTLGRCLSSARLVSLLRPWHPSPFRWTGSDIPTHTAAEGLLDSGCRPAGLATSTGQNPAKRDQLKVLYDGECPLCMKEIRLLRKINQTKQTLHFVDISQPGYDPSLYGNVTYERAMEEMHVVTPDGQIVRRVAAMREIYKSVGLGWIWSFTTLPVVATLADKLYMWFARNRLKWTGKNCENGKCKR